MGSLFRSEEMTQCQLILHSETAFDCVSELGKLGLVQFCDLNPTVIACHRKFVNEVRQCDELELKLRSLEKEVKQSVITIMDTIEDPEALQPNEIHNLQTIIEKLQHELCEVNSTTQLLKEDIKELIEFKQTLGEVEMFIEKVGEPISSDCLFNHFFHYDDGHTGDDRNFPLIQLGFVTGTIDRERISAFERMLWRSFRGNVFIHQSDREMPLEDPITGNKIYKSVFIIVFQDQLKASVRKICNGFRVKLYPCPNSSTECKELAENISTRLEDLTRNLGLVEEERNKVLMSAAEKFKIWFIRVRKMKAIYHTLNLFNVDVTRKSLIGECWIAVRDIESVQLALQQGIKRNNSTVSPVLDHINTLNNPPTYNKTNKFTKAFQILIDSYGVASYREVNPAPFTIITFPFLFSIMFGDLGHGIIIFLLAAYMIYKENILESKKSNNEIWSILFNGRYVLLLMGMFSIYSGIIYNEIFSKSFNILQSRWNVSLSVNDMMSNKLIELDPKDTYLHTPYPIGLDPVWQLAENKIRFLNSYKMKISIIIGVLHMLLGVSLQCFNFIYRKRYSDIFTLFLPQVFFLLFLFFYMELLIFMKWIFYGTNNSMEMGPGCAPSILITFINMVLFTPGVDNRPCSPWMYNGQQIIQPIIMIIALLSIPWMFFSKICLMTKKEKTQGIISNKDIKGNLLISSSQKIIHQDMTEVWIHQSIHTIEFILGSVSHTASYLRLWALSLAHAQLSDVLWKMVMRQGLTWQSTVGGVVLSLVFLCWALLTVGILILMEGLSAFLHTLRLHWVEFQSKFFTGTGFPFLPFSFKVIIEETFYDNDE